MSPTGARALAEWPLLAAEIILFGTTAFELALAPRDIRARGPVVHEMTPLWRILALVLIVSAPFGLITDVASMGDVNWSGAIPLIPEVIRETHAGRIWVWRTITVIAIAMVAWLAADRKFTPAALCALGAIMLMLESVASHASDWGDAMIAVYFIHQMAAALWAGALIGLCFGQVFGDETDPVAHWIHQVAPRVSTVAGWSVAVLFASGGLIAWRALGLDPFHLLYSAYGRTLILKVGLFAAVVAIGGYNRYWLIPEVGNSPTHRILVRNVAVECIFLIGVFGIAAVLANTPPAH